MLSPEQMNIGISKSRFTDPISFLAVRVISERFSCEGVVCEGVRCEGCGCEW